MMALTLPLAWQRAPLATFRPTELTVFRLPRSRAPLDFCGYPAVGRAMAPSAKKTIEAAADAAPKVGDQNNPHAMVKASMRFQAIVSKHGLPHGRPEPRRIFSGEVLPSPLNRLGRPLNLPYIHNEVIVNLAKDGFNPTRPNPGFVIKRTKPATLARLHEHSAKLHSSQGNLLPPLVINEKTNKECVGGNHLTMSIRMYASGYKSPLSGVSCVPKDDPHLQMVVDSGHLYYELDDEISDEDAAFLSEHLNSDQNQNQCDSEDHVRRMVQAAVTKLTAVDKPTVPISSIVDYVCGNSLVKIRPDTIGDIAKFVVSFGVYNDELCEWYGVNVNPKEISVTARWMAELAKALGEQRPLTKLGACFVQYRGLARLEQRRPSPDISRTIDAPLLNSLVNKDVSNLDATEEFLRDNRKLLEKYFEKHVGRTIGLKLFHMFEELAVRLLCGKTMTGTGMTHAVSGKFSVEKLKVLQAAWAKHVQGTCSELSDMMRVHGIKEETADAPEEAGVGRNRTLDMEGPGMTRTRRAGGGCGRRCRRGQTAGRGW